MTSECFVYITLPGETQPVTAGKYAIVARAGQSAVGKFIYGRSYLARPNKVEIDPVELGLRTSEFTSARYGGAFGALRDASPDEWGRRLIEVRLGEPNPSELQYLLNSPDDRAGALGFGLGVTPPGPERPFNRTLDLEKLIDVADAIMAAEADPDAPSPVGDDARQIEALMLAGTSMGGARPKATVEDEEGLWLAKFPQKNDKWNNTRVEHAMLTLARECGLSAAESRITNVAGRDVILVKRFDRHRTDDGYFRSRMVSALTLLQADDSPNSNERRAEWSYLLLAEQLARLATTSKSGDLTELFRRICFNALISNSDDHPRNHAIVAKNAGWQLSPAYDLTPTLSVAVERRDLAMSFGRWGRYANRSNLLSRCEKFRLNESEAAAIIDEMTTIVRTRWYPIAREVGVSQRDCELLRRAFVYEGFDYDLAELSREPVETALDDGYSPGPGGGMR